MSKPVKEKIKVLWYSDFLRHTGFGNVAEEILKRLEATGDYEFYVIGINYDGSPYHKPYPGNEYLHLKEALVWPALSPLRMGQDSIFGWNRLSEFLVTKDFDIFFALQDAFNMAIVKEAIVKSRAIKNYKYIFYFPVDGDFKHQWFTDAVQIADYPITYSDFGIKKIKEIMPDFEINKIPHGIDLNVFKPFDSEEERSEFRKDYFAVNKDEFLISNINRNQPRKDLPRCMMAFSEFCKRYPEINAKLYLHCHPQDTAGHKIHDIASKYLNNLALNKIISPDPELLGKNGFSIDKMAKIYAASDLVTSTTFGEGWGLSTTEAMACKTPVVMPDNSALSEIVGVDRGYLVKSGGDMQDYVVQKYDNELLRPITDMDDLISKWKFVYDNRDDAKIRAENAYKWLQNFNWDDIVKQWDVLFKEAYNAKLESKNSIINFN